MEASKIAEEWLFCLLQGDLCKGPGFCKWLGASCRSHEAAAVVQRTMDEECENICKLSSFFVARVLTDWQAAVMYAKSHPSSVHVMVRIYRLSPVFVDPPVISPALLSCCAA